MVSFRRVSHCCRSLGCVCTLVVLVGDSLLLLLVVDFVEANDFLEVRLRFEVRSLDLAVLVLLDRVFALVPLRLRIRVDLEVREDEVFLLLLTVSGSSWTRRYMRGIKRGL